MLKQSLPYIIAGVILVLLFALLGYPLLNRKSEAEKNLTENLSALQKIYSSPNLPSDELIAAMEKDNSELINKYLQLKTKLPVTKKMSIVQGDLPLYYMEQLRKVKEKIKANAQEKGVNISTEDFGLPPALPSTQDAPYLIENLYITEKVINLLLEVGINSIDGIMLAAASNTDMYTDIPLTLSLKCDMPSLTKLLFTLENTKEEFFIIRNFSLVSTTTDTETASRSQASDRMGEGRVAGTQQEKIIKVDLALSIIRWK